MLYARVFSVSAESLRVGIADVHGIELCGEENEENEAKSAFCAAFSVQPDTQRVQSDVVFS